MGSSRQGPTVCREEVWTLVRGRAWYQDTSLVPGLGRSTEYLHPHGCVIHTAALCREGWVWAADSWVSSVVSGSVLSGWLGYSVLSREVLVCDFLRQDCLGT